MCTLTGSKSGVFEKFIVTNSNPIITSGLPTDDVFTILDILPQVIEDLGYRGPEE
jgi:hypothetical protein